MNQKQYETIANLEFQTTHAYQALERAVDSQNNENGALASSMYGVITQNLVRALNYKPIGEARKKDPYDRYCLQVVVGNFLAGKIASQRTTKIDSSLITQEETKQTISSITELINERKNYNKIGNATARLVDPQHAFAVMTYIRETTPLPAYAFETGPIIATASDDTTTDINQKQKYKVNKTQGLFVPGRFVMSLMGEEITDANTEFGDQTAQQQSQKVKRVTDWIHPSNIDFGEIKRLTELNIYEKDLRALQQKFRQLNESWQEEGESLNSVLNRICPDIFAKK